MEVEKIVKEKEIVHEDGWKHKEYATKGVGNAGLTLGIIGTALGAYAVSRRGGGLFGGWGGGGMPENVNINTLGGGVGGGQVAPTAFQAYDKSCENEVALTAAIYQMRIQQMNERFADRQVLNGEFFGLYQSQNQADFGLYKSQRDADDVLKGQIDDLKCEVAVLKATRPYQDKLIMCEINDARKDAAYALDRRTCRMITGELVLPSTPTVTGYPSYSPCGSQVVTPA